MEATYLRFATKTASMSISPLHHVFVNGIETDPSHVKLGDLLRTPHDLEPVTRIDSIKARGMYHVIVKGGSYFVDGILASDYSGLVPHMAWPLVRAYVEARYRIGVPVIPDGRGFFPNKIWASDLLARLGAPLSVHHALSPVTIASSIATELANVAIEHLAPLLGAAAMAAVITKVARKFA